MRTAVVGLLIGASALSGVACSDGGESDAAQRSTVTSGATSSTTFPPFDDNKVAADLVVKQADFPTGWNHSQPADQVEDPADACFKSGPLVAASGRAESDEFAKTDLATASSLAFVFPNEGAATAAFAHAAGGQTRACLDQAMRAELTGDGEGEEGVELGPAALTKSDFPTVGAETVAYQFSAETRGTDQPYRYMGNLVLVRSGRALLAFAFGNIGEPVPPSEQRMIATKVAARAPKG